MQAIETKYLNPTYTKGARVKASAEAGSITAPFDYGTGIDGAHDNAAIALIRKLGWFGVWVRGGRPDGEGNVYVCISRPDSLRTPHPQVTNPLDYIVVRP